MKIHSRAFNLKSIQRDIYIININNVWYPCNKNDVEFFIYGSGWKKLTKKQIATIKRIDNLSENWTALEIQNIGNQYGNNVAMGMIEGWCSSNLYDDRSYGLDYAKNEILVMIKYGVVYDTFMTSVQEIGNQFLTELFNKGYSLQGNCIYYKDEFQFFVDYTKIHLTEYIDTSLYRWLIIRPSFDSLNFDKLMFNLLYAQDKSLVDTIISVKDRISFLSNLDIASKIESIFEMQKIFE